MGKVYTGPVKAILGVLSAPFMGSRATDPRIDAPDGDPLSGITREAHP